jgi:lysozyme
MANKWAKTAAATSSAGVIAATVVFLPAWEGMDTIARPDRIGTGHPVTYCYGMTGERGKVKAGTRFTKQQCDAMLAEELPKYLAQIEPCIKVSLPDKTKASLLDAAWNAGPAAVCRSPMVARMNEMKFTTGCNAFDGWYVRSDSQVRPGLIARRAGEKHGDHRKSERALCLEGLKEGLTDVNRAAKADRSPIPAAPHFHWTDYVRNWWRVFLSKISL